MANCYLEIHCQYCGESLRIAGYLPSIDFQINPADAGKVVAWVNKHLLHHQDSVDFAPTLSRPGVQFKIVPT